MFAEIYASHEVHKEKGFNSELRNSSSIVSDNLATKEEKVNK